jgi:hypothetical protein
LCGFRCPHVIDRLDADAPVFADFPPRYWEGIMCDMTNWREDSVPALDCYKLALISGQIQYERNSIMNSRNAIAPY